MSAVAPHAAQKRRRRWALTLAVMLPPCALLVLAAPGALKTGAVPELVCWVLPNLRVLPTPGNEACPVGASETIARAQRGPAVTAIEQHADLRAAVARAGSALRLGVRAGARERWLEVPVRRSERADRLARAAAGTVGVLFLLGIPVLLVWRSAARAATPLAAFYGFASVVLVTTLVGQHSLGMTRTALLALVFAPAAALHLSLVFPRERPILSDLRSLAALPYAFAGLLVPVGWVALERYPLLWTAFVSLLLALTASAWAVLALACAFSLRESRSALERARARLVLYGAVLVPLLPTFLLSRGDAGIGQVATAYLWSAAVTMPLPIALAIGRHNLFDLEWDARHASARIVYLAIAASVVALLIGAALAAAQVESPLRAPAPLLLLATACVGAIDPLRGRMLGALEALMGPQLQRWRALREELARALSLRQDEDEIALLCADALERGLALRSCAVLIEVRGRWRLAHASGESLKLPEACAADAALRALGAGALVHLAASSELHDRAPELASAGIEAVLALESGGTRYGLLLLGSLRRRRPHNGMELDFAAALAAQTASALRSARLTAELVAAERHAAAGRVALGLAHDVGKDLGWMRTLVKRLPERVGDPERLARDAGLIAELTEGLAGSIERFVREATEQARARAVARRLDELLDETLRRSERLHGSGRVVLQLEPALRGLRVHESLGRALGNLLDNALYASPAGATVQLRATRARGGLWLQVEDSGCGMSEQQLARAFEPGFTTRGDAGGSGVGLPVALSIVEALGGRLELCSSASGTRATLRLPVAR